MQGEDINDLTEIHFLYNLYNNNTAFSRLNYTDYSFSQWQTSLTKDVTGSSMQDPGYVNSSQDDFHLQLGSVALNAGIDRLNLQGNGNTASVNQGAYVTGTENIGTRPDLPALPNPPTNITVDLVP